MKFKGIIFDLDGTLANTLPLCIKAYQYTFQHFTGRSLSVQEATEHFGLTEAGIFQRRLPEQWEESLQHFFVTYEKFHDECNAPFPGVVEALQLLKERGVSMAIVTGKGDHTAAYTLKYLDLAQYFERVEVGDANVVVKSLAIRKILSAWNMQPDVAAYVGDTASDMKEAAAAGVLPLGAAWAETATLHHQTSTPVMTFTTLPDFTNWLDANTATNTTSSSA